MRERVITDRLLIRDVTEADAELMFALDSDPVVMRYIGPQVANDASWYRDRIRTKFIPKQAHPWHGVRVVFSRTGGDYLGNVSVRPANESPDSQTLGWNRASDIEIGFRFHQSAWGRGIATEAAKALIKIALADPTTKAIVAYADASNVASLRVLQKLGLACVEEVLLPEECEPTVKLSRLRGSANSVGEKQGS